MITVASVAAIVAVGLLAGRHRDRRRLAAPATFAVALAAGAHGVHLGQEDLATADLEAIRAKALRTGATRAGKLTAVQATLTDHGVTVETGVRVEQIDHAHRARVGHDPIAAKHLVELTTVRCGQQAYPWSCSVASIGPSMNSSTWVAMKSP